MTYEEVLPPTILSRYGIMETGSAAKIIAAICPDELADIIEVLDGFSLTSQLLLSPGGNRGPVPTILDSRFASHGWIEARVDTETKIYLFPGHNAHISAEENPADYEDNLTSRFYQRGYSVDNFKGRIALDVEWNPKDGNLDRDFAAYRAWFDTGVIAAAVLVVRMQDATKNLAKTVWDRYVIDHPEHGSKKQLVTYSTTTTANFEKARQRILRGDLGTCPVLVFGVSERTWDGQPWDGRIWHWNSAIKELELVDPKFKSNDASLYTYEVDSLE